MKNIGKKIVFLIVQLLSDFFSSFYYFNYYQKLNQIKTLSHIQRVLMKEKSNGVHEVVSNIRPKQLSASTSPIVQRPLLCLTEKEEYKWNKKELYLCHLGSLCLFAKAPLVHSKWTELTIPP